MNTKLLSVLSLFAICSFQGFSQNKSLETAKNNLEKYTITDLSSFDSSKVKAIEDYRRFYAKHAHRGHSLGKLKSPLAQSIAQLNNNGTFSDLDALKKQFSEANAFQNRSAAVVNEVGLFLTEAYNRIWSIAEAYRNGKLSKDEAFNEKVLKAIIHYGNIELSRPNDGPRFHASCFAIPTAAVNTYFCFLNDMDRIENNKGSDLELKACNTLKSLGIQAWTQPFRNDFTDENVVQIERFRNHVWWVGGNALAYRSLIPVGFMLKSIPMIDLISEVAQRGISKTSQHTYDKAFWTEGFTADGAGWGHGMQCLIWGYPIDGTSNALSILSDLKGSPWAKKLSPEHTDALLNYFRGGNWYYYKGYELPCLSRHSMVYEPKESPIRYTKMLNSILKDWSDSFTSDQIAELKQLQKEAKTNRILMAQEKDGVYNGTRWFFNNDDLIKKNNDYHIIVNMASSRVDGLESAAKLADEYNFYSTDGLTLFQKSGNEYSSIYGSFDVTSSPGVTSRIGMDKLEPVTNWRGYCSSHNFAAGASSGGNNAVSGYIFEKMNAATKQGVNDKGSSALKNDMLYGFKAYKANFMIDDYFIALGAGITNFNPNIDMPLHTTIDQTALVDEISIIKNGKTTIMTDSLMPVSGSSSPVWISQKGKFAYTILPEYTHSAYVAKERKKTNWVERNLVNKKTKNLPGESSILRLWIDHGKNPQQDTYGYVVYASDKVPSGKLPFEVLRNDTLIQAVALKNKNVVEAVFYPNADHLIFGKNKIKVSAPCALMIERNKEKVVLSVTDAEMNANLKEIVVSINGKQIRVSLPQGELCGKAASQAISLKESNLR
ncbi:MAG: polysaccharide lyase family 8 super-sandwich domain-containing protein [Bacteroidales bacterium]